MANKFKLESAKSIEKKEAITQSLSIANNYAGELTIEVLPLHKIELDPENNRDMVLTLQDALTGIDKSDPDYERKKQEWKSLESLARSIKNDQLMNPIYVYRYGNSCRLIAGERRTLASAIAGKKEIIARIASQRPVGTKLRVLQWVENNERSNLSLAERIASLEAILKEYKIENKKIANIHNITAKVLADLAGISERQACRYMLVITAEPEIRKVVDEGKIENIQIMELICSADTPEQRATLLSAAIAGSSLEALLKIKQGSDSRVARTLKKPGRKKINVNLGSVKMDLVKVILNALVSSKNVKIKSRDEFIKLTDSIQWSDSLAVAKSFKKIAALIECGE